MSFYELAKARYSVRKFSDKPVEKEVIDKIIEAGRIAPTAHNNQPQMVYVLQSEEAMKKANELTPCIYGAPAALLVCYDENAAWKNEQRPGYDSGECDATIVCTHMMLQAWELGIGSCWVGMFDDIAVSKAFNLPDNVKPAAFLPIGYLVENSRPAKLHDQIRPIEETVAYL
ncbi:MAG: nitroreductase [Clostridiales bacterium]|nr:nitroreductase [Clostridiales bacterium]